ncbi:MAG: alpha/beta fold hydrolase [Syntrophaceae bacterium]
MKRLEIDFKSRGERCAAWLYLPDGIAKPPVVVMAHGLGAERSFRLPAYAERFASKGLAALVFDYRSFGDSAGTPRNLISPRRHLQDWRSALTHVRSLTEIDPRRVALWGTSFSGGHVLVTAASDHGIAALVAQIPFVDGVSTTMLFDLKYQVSGTLHGLYDLFSLLVLKRRHTVPIIGKPEAFALMNTPDAEGGMRALIPSDSAWQNEAPALITLSIPFYRPLACARRITAPTMIVAAEKDALIAYAAVKKTAGRIVGATFISLPVGHFEVYVGELFEKAVELEGNFLHANLNR